MGNKKETGGHADFFSKRMAAITLFNDVQDFIYLPPVFPLTLARRSTFLSPPDKSRGIALR